MHRRFHSGPSYAERDDVERRNVGGRQSVALVSGLNGRTSVNWDAVP
jgi:hypothetical protein